MSHVRTLFLHVPFSLKICYTLGGGRGQKKFRGRAHDSNYFGSLNGIILKRNKGGFLSFFLMKRVETMLLRGHTEEKG